MITKIFVLSLTSAGGTTILQSPFGDDSAFPVLRGSNQGFENEQEGNVEATSMVVGEAFAETGTTNWLGKGGAELRKEKHTEEADIHVDEVRDKKTSSDSLVVPHETLQENLENYDSIPISAKIFGEASMSSQYRDYNIALSLNGDLDDQSCTENIFGSWWKFEFQETMVTRVKYITWKLDQIHLKMGESTVFTKKFDVYGPDLGKVRVLHDFTFDLPSPLLADNIVLSSFENATDPDNWGVLCVTDFEAYGYSPVCK